MTNRQRWKILATWRLTIAILLAIGGSFGIPAPTRGEVPPQVLAAQAERVAIAERLAQQTVAVFDSAGQGGGSGVLISSDGFALTNFHVTVSCGAAMKCGLADGKLYDAVIVGIDPPGDVALIRLLGRTDFPAAELGDSDQVRIGDWVYVLGNPFLLAEDYRPTVTYGIVSGTHRYQYPAGTLLEYADCIQTDASINPGNSGGPMFDANGRLIGINGRGSFEKRGRVNVGVGYAISINQIKRFMSQLRAGRLVDHATLGATATSVSGGRVVIDDVLDTSDAYRRGLRYGDYLVSLDGRELHNANALKNALGTYPSGWRVTMEYRRQDETFRRVVRLASLHATGELEGLVEAGAQNPEPIEPPGEDDPKDKKKDPKPPSRRPPPAKVPEIPAVVKEVFEERSGFANYWFNRQEQTRVAEACRQWRVLHPQSTLVLHGSDQQGQEVYLRCNARQANYRSSRGEFFAEVDRTIDEGVSPPGSGGLLAAAAAWRQMLSLGYDGFGEAYYFGELPFGPTLAQHDMVSAVYQGANVYFYFDVESGDLVGLELYTADDLDPCIVYFSRFEEMDGKRLPRHWEVHFGDEPYVAFEVDRYEQPTESEGDAP